MLALALAWSLFAIGPPARAALDDPAPETAIAPVNAAIGDASWVARHGAPPTAEADGVERIRVHLDYVADHLAARDVTALDPSARARRAEAIAHLRTYAAAGVFPRRGPDGYGPRRPRFIDDRGVHCAVGELIRHSGHPDLARAIDAEAEYAYVPDIHTAGLDAWATAHGFTRAELAMIQPNYEWFDPPPPPPLPPVDRLSEGTIRRLQFEGGVHAAACALRHPLVREVLIDLDGDAGELPEAEVPGWDAPFETCLAERIEAVVRAERPRAAPINLRLAVRVDTSGIHFICAFDLFHPARDARYCWPNTLATGEVTITLEADHGKAEIDVSTDPGDREREVCIARRLRARLGRVGRVRIDLRAHHDFDDDTRNTRVDPYASCGGGRPVIGLVIEGYGATRTAYLDIPDPTVAPR